MFKRVAKWQGYELRKDFEGHATIYKDGSLVDNGKEYRIGRKWLDIKEGA